MFRFLVIVALALGVAVNTGAARADMVPRTAIIVTDGVPDGVAAQMAVPVLRRLGLVPEIHRADTGLPDLAERSDVAGVVIWLDEGRVEDGPAFLAWVRRLTTAGTPIALMGETPAIEDRFGLFVTLGLLYAVEARPYTYDLSAVERDPRFTAGARRGDSVWPVADQVRPLEPHASAAALILQRGADVDDRTMPLLFTPRVAYAAPGYAVWRSPDSRHAAWRIDPAAWFTRAFHLSQRPVPDADLINARRIFLPALAPMDEAAANHVVRAATGLSRGQTLEVMLDPPFDARRVVPGCGQTARGALFGFDAMLGTTTGAPLTALTPVVTMCAHDPEPSRAAIRAAYAYAIAHPLFTAPLELDEIEQGFRSAEIETDGDLSWRIRARGALNTLRFDAPGALRIDWYRSEGVLGAARLGGALVVALDPAADEPRVALTGEAFEPPPFAVLVESRWRVSGLERDADNAAMRVEGFGPGDMVWQVEPRSDWEIRYQPAEGATVRWRALVDDSGIIAFSLPSAGASAGTLTFERHDYAGAGP